MTGQGNRYLDARQRCSFASSGVGDAASTGPGGRLVELLGTSDPVCASTIRPSTSTSRPVPRFATRPNHDLIEGAGLERSGLEVALRRRTLPMLARREDRQ